MNRALEDRFSFYCMANCHRLPNKVCSTIEEKLKDTTASEYGLVFIYDASERGSRIRTCLDKYFIRSPKNVDTLALAQYVEKLLQVPSTVTTVDPKRLVDVGMSATGKLNDGAFITVTFMAACLYCG